MDLTKILFYFISHGYLVRTWSLTLLNVEKFLGVPHKGSGEFSIPAIHKAGPNWKPPVYSPF